MIELKTLKDLESFEWVFKNSVFIEELKKEATKRIKNCCPSDNVGGVPMRKYARCDACKRDIWFYNLKEEDLKDE